MIIDKEKGGVTQNCDLVLIGWHTENQLLSPFMLHDRESITLEKESERQKSKNCLTAEGLFGMD